MWTDYTQSPTEFSTDFAPRILSFSNGTQKRFNNAGSRYLEYLNENTNEIVKYTTIPFAMVRSVVRNGVVEAEVPMILTYHNAAKNLTQTSGLIKDYWSSTIQMLKDGKALTINFIMSTNNFKDVDFRTPIYFSAPEEIQGYWLFELIQNVKITNETQSVMCKLVKVINYAPLDVETPAITDTGGNIPIVRNEILSPRRPAESLYSYITALTNTTGEGI
jgi:hypothetical protein